MKKRLLFVLTILALMCAVMFSVSAADCSVDGHNYVKTEVHYATCTEKGYDLYKCSCGSFYKGNYKNPLGHDWGADNFVKNGSHFINERECARCKVVEPEREKDENGNYENVKYYSVEFINGQDFNERQKTVKVTSGGRDYEVSVMYTVLAKRDEEGGTKNTGLQTDYVREGQSISYRGNKPIRTKDVDFGAYRFVGWTTVDADTVNADTVEIKAADYKKSIEINANVKYYAAWEGQNVSYSIVVYNSDRSQILEAQHIMHGSKINYPYSYPPRESETSVDFIFDGWEMGTKNATDDSYSFYDKDEAHIKNIPIYAQESIVAVHITTPRIYKIDFCDANWNSQAVVDVPYGHNVTNNMSGITFGNYTDDVYSYQYRGYWETEKGEPVYLNSFAFSKGFVDHDDLIYLADVNGKLLKDASGKEVVVENLHYQYDNTNLFNKNVITYLYPVTEKGVKLENAAGREICIAIDGSGVFVLEANGDRTPFSATDAQNLRNIKVKPAYQRLLRKYNLEINLTIPEDELVPNDYSSGLVVQITNENGQLLAAGTTSNWRCSLPVTKAEMYNITVVSPNGKYFAEKGIVWTFFKGVLDDTTITDKSFQMDLQLNNEYKEDNMNNCRCICHNSFFRGVWVRVLNILYSLFKVKYVCCSDMYITLGDLLAYTK